jgi:hypothetical protein
MYVTKQRGKRSNMDDTWNSCPVPRKKLMLSPCDDVVLASTSDVEGSEYQKCILS